MKIFFTAIFLLCSAFVFAQQKPSKDFSTPLHLLQQDAKQVPDRVYHSRKKQAMQFEVMKKIEFLFFLAS